MSSLYPKSLGIYDMNEDKMNNENGNDQQLSKNFDSVSKRLCYDDTILTKLSLSDDNDANQIGNLRRVQTIRVSSNQRKPLRMALPTFLQSSNDDDEARSFIPAKDSMTTVVQTRYPTYVGDVAEVCLQLCEQRIKQNRTEIHGIVHFSGTQKYTKFQMAILIASLFHLPIDHIERDQGSVSNANVQRPDNAALDSSKLSHDFGIHIDQVNFETTIRRCLESFL
ncbi:unnamed protein product [Adineta steineri]|uniref:Methionine adenosyltransferase 2 subunit beta n=1 Tax=Adineta steineri TaxID=433720 RepID=A0A813NGA6_9BILA|nr:unnamed protein product [Adineta steineri]